MIFLAIIETSLGEVIIWAVLALFACITFIFVYFLLPETKGRSLEDVLELFENKKGSLKLG
jgi:hypothetical protein